MADTMSPLPPPPPPPPPPPALAPSASKGGRIHHHRRRRHREGLGFTDSDVAAAHQLIQLSDDSDEDKRRPAKGGGGGGAVDREVASARIEEIFGRESGDRRRDGLGLPRKKRYRSIAEIYAETAPMEFRRMGGHHMIR